MPYIKELNDLAHREDPTRLTVAASNTDGALNFVTDAMAWNRYDGWYGGTPAGLGQWLDHMHTTHPDLRIAISEYGAGASLYHQQDTLVKTVATSFWHPENWQTHYHMANWHEISARPFVWGSFIWNLFDFGAAHRHEGDRVGINDKGLVSFDRRTRKDAFYFYKANWNKEIPLLYLAERRCTRRTRPVQTFMAFTNQPEAELFVNGTSCGHAKTDSLGTDFSFIGVADGYIYAFDGTTITRYIPGDGTPEQLRMLGTFNWFGVTECVDGRLYNFGGTTSFRGTETASKGFRRFSPADYAPVSVAILPD